MFKFRVQASPTHTELIHKHFLSEQLSQQVNHQKRRKFQMIILE